MLGPAARPGHGTERALPRAALGRGWDRWDRVPALSSTLKVEVSGGQKCHFTIAEKHQNLFSS